MFSSIVTSHYGKSLKLEIHASEHLENILLTNPLRDRAKRSAGGNRAKEQHSLDLLQSQR